MTDQPRLIGEPILRILCKRSDMLVGYLYLWDNGDLQPAWMNEAVSGVRYEQLTETAQES